MYQTKASGALWKGCFCIYIWRAVNHQRSFRESLFILEWKALPVVTQSRLSVIRDAVVNGNVLFQEQAGLRISIAAAKYNEIIRNNIISSESKDNDESGISLRTQVSLLKNQSDSTKLQAPTVPNRELRTEQDWQVNFGLKMYPSLFPSDARYSGVPTVPVRRRFKIFLKACQLCRLDVEAKTAMFPFM